MLANPPSELAASGSDGTASRLAWPVAILSDDKGRDVGFLMPMVNLKAAYPLDYFYDQTLFKKLKSPNEAALSFKLEIARNLSALVAALHDHGHCFIDMKPQNIRVTLGSHEICLLDCDGFSIAGPSGNRYPAELLSTDYISPEAFRGNTPPSALGEEQDRYALAVLLFQLLNRGTHPFQGIPRDASVDVATNDEKAAQGMYPHGRSPHPSLRPRPHSIHEQFDDGLRALFDQAFVAAPRFRPSAKDWAQKFESLLTSKSLARCPNFPNDVSHMRFRGKQCPACYLASIPAVGAGPRQVAKPATVTAPPPAPPPAPTPPRSPPKKITILGRDIIILGVPAMWFLLTLLADCSGKKSSPLPPAPVTPPTVASSSLTATPSCSVNFNSETPKQLCDLYWGNQMTRCDGQLLAELQRRELLFTPKSACGKPIGGSTTSPPKADPVVREIQRKLNELGYDAGIEDGLMGKRTRAAISAFQLDSGLVADGKATPEILQLLSAPQRVEGRREQSVQQPQKDERPAISPPAPFEQETEAEQTTGARGLAEEDEARRKAEGERFPEERDPESWSQPSFLSDTGGGVLLQPARGLLWTQSDNGSEINLDDARAYCAAKGGGWRLPTTAELGSLLGNQTASCGTAICKVSPHFDLTYWNFWSSDTYGQYGTSVDLVSGAGGINDAYWFKSSRALCVKSI